MNKKPDQNEKKKPLARKPSFKQPPEVKQTLASKYRLLKNNPLIAYNIEKNLATEAGSTKPIFAPLKTLAKELDKSTSINQRITPSTTSTKTTNRFNTSTRITADNKRKNDVLRKTTTNNSSKIDFTPGRFLSSTRLEARPSFRIPNPNTKNAPPHPKTGTIIPKQPHQLRRSISAHTIKPPKKPDPAPISTPKRIKSFEALPQASRTQLPPGVSPVVEEAAAIFKTPSAYQRRSILKTPVTLNNRKSLFLSTPNADQLAKQLKSWLEKRGKSIGEYHHLKCFGAHGKKAADVNVIDEENKENVEVKIVDKGSYEDLKIVGTEEVEAEKNCGAEEDLESVAKEALLDLHNLILEGYPVDQCSGWLQRIHQKYTTLEEESQYWECRAAIEQSRGNITSAVECYKTAIVHGAEVKAVDESLDQLLQKFSLLNIAKEASSGQKESKDRERIIQDARNVFKSSIIQFAVQERKFKKNQKVVETSDRKFVATPVRRSTRLSRSAFTSTPGVKIYSSLLDVAPEVRGAIDFKNNNALAN